jgi:signal peptidase I
MSDGLGRLSAEFSHTMIVVRWFALVVSVIAALSVVAGAGLLAITGQRVVGTSMEPTLAEGTVLMANPLNRAPVRFDIVVLHQPGGSSDLVKRVVGMPGDRFEIGRGPYGEPVIRVSPRTGQPWFIVTRTAEGSRWRTMIDCCGPDGRLSARPTVVTIPVGGYFVLGDNPERSVDSRTFGFVTAGEIRAVVGRLLWPPGRLAHPGFRLQPVGN